jgi:hypothetical protein
VDARSGIKSTRTNRPLRAAVTGEREWAVGREIRGIRVDGGCGVECVLYHHVPVFLRGIGRGVGITEGVWWGFGRMGWAVEGGRDDCTG